MNEHNPRTRRRGVVQFLIGLLAAALLIVGLAATVTAYRGNLPWAHPTPTPSAVGSVSAARPTPTPTAAQPTPAPTSVAAQPATGKGSAPLVGTYWVCTSDQTDAGVVLHSEDAQIEAQGGVRSPTCQRDMKLVPGAFAFRVPVGHFTPVRFCGVLVANILDPWQGHLPPSHWVASDELLYNYNWTQGAPSGTC